MPAPTVVGTPVASRYSDPSLTVPSGADYVIGGGSYVTGGSDPGATATFGGNAMTKVAEPASYSGLDLASVIFGYASPSTGAQTFAPAGTGRVNRAACALDEVDAGTPTGATATNQGTGTSPSLTVSSDTNALVVAVLSFGTSAGVTVSAGTGETIQVQYVEDGRASAIITKAGASSVSFAPTLSASTDWAITGISVNGTVSTSAAVTGTLVATPAIAADVVAGGKTIVLTLTGDTWVAAGATFDAVRQDIIDGLDAATSPTNGWNNRVRDVIGVSTVVRTSNTVVTITLPAVSNYAITSAETITVTVPASAVALAAPITASPTFPVRVGDTLVQPSGTTDGSGVLASGTFATDHNGTGVRLVRHVATVDGVTLTEVHVTPVVAP